MSVVLSTLVFSLCSHARARQNVRMQTWQIEKPNMHTYTYYTTLHVWIAWQKSDKDVAVSRAFQLLD